jgi:hypothetical protein
MMPILGYIRKHYILILVIITTLILIVVHLNLRAYAFDDAYIHFRIASHLADYGEPFFNRGEAVMASSSTGWTILLALLVRCLQTLGLNVDLPVIVSLVNALATAAGAYVYTFLFDRLVQNPQPWLVRTIFFLTYLGMILPTSIGLMETPLVMLFVGIALLLLLNKSRWSLICLSVLPFFRPELVVVTGLTSLFIIMTRRFSIKDFAFYFVLGATPFIIFELYFFKTLIPNTVITKSVVYSLTYIETFRYFVAKIFEDLALLSMFLKITLVQKLYFAGYEVWVIVSFLFIYLYKTVRHDLKIKHSIDEKELLGLLFLSWFWLVVFMYLYKRVFIFGWYDPLYTIPLLLIMGKTISDSPRRITLLLGIMLLPLLLGQLSSLMQVNMGAFIDQRYLPEFLISARVRNYIEIGRKLYDKFPDAQLMTSEIGGLGYGFKGYIYDGVGLVSPEALKYHPINPSNNYGGIPAGFVEEKQPGLIVSYDIFIQDLLESNVLDGYVHFQYPLLLEDDMERVGTERIFKSDALNVYVRNDLIR